MFSSANAFNLDQDRILLFGRVKHSQVPRFYICFALMKQISDCHEFSTCSLSLGKIVFSVIVKSEIYLINETGISNHLGEKILN